MAKAPPMAWDTMPPRYRARLASWLDDQAHDLEVDRRNLIDNHGFDFVAAVEGLAEHVRRQS